MTRWHLDECHPTLEAHLHTLLPDQSSPRSVLFPLCGASVDLSRVASLGHCVVGVEGVRWAVDRLLREHGKEVALPPGRQSIASHALRTARPRDARKAAEAGELLAVEGDFLAIGASDLERMGLQKFNAAFDRGGIVAVDQAERPRYAEVLSELMAPAGRVLLVVTEHEPAFGPPHSVDEAEVRSLFEKHFAVRILSRTDVLEAEPHWRERGATSFSEAAYLLTRRPPSGLSTREARKKFRTGMRGTASTRPTPPAAG